MHAQNSRAYEGLARIYSNSMYYSPSHVIIFTEAALQFDPVNMAELFFLRGKALMSMQRLEEAYVDFTQCIEYLTLSQIHHLFLKNSEVYHSRMLTSLELGLYDEALKDCARVSETDRIDRHFIQGGGDCYLQCGRILLHKKQYTQAARFLKHAQTHNRDYHLVCLSVKCQLGQFEEALQHFEQFLVTAGQHCSVHPDHATYMDIAITLFMNEMFDQAIDYWWACCMRFNCVDGFPLLAMRDEELLRIKQHTLAVAVRQKRDFDTCFQQEDNAFTFADVHIAWSYYYFLVGMTYTGRYISRLNLSRRADNEEDLRWGLTNFTRAITLNPTLSEAFYMRALLQCYLLVDQLLVTRRTSSSHHRSSSLSTGSNLSNNLTLIKKIKRRSNIQASLPEIHSRSRSLSSNGARNTVNGREEILRPGYRHSSPIQGFPRVEHASNADLESQVSTHKLRTQHNQIAQKIMSGNLLREALNDVNNACTLATMDMSEQLTNENALLMLADLECPFRRRKGNEAADDRLMIYLIDIHILKAYILGCIGKFEQALEEIDLALQETDRMHRQQRQKREHRQKLRLRSIDSIDDDDHYFVSYNPLYDGEHIADEVSMLYDNMEMELALGLELQGMSSSRWFDDYFHMDTLRAVPRAKPTPIYADSELIDNLTKRCQVVRAILTREPIALKDAQVSKGSMSSSDTSGFHELLDIILIIHAERLLSS